MAAAQTMSLADDAGSWALDLADVAEQRTRIAHAPLPGAPRPRVLEAVPPFAFLAMPEQRLA
jgi:hypothetical protein